MRKRSSTRNIIEIFLILVAFWIIVIPGILAYVMVPDSKVAETSILSLAIFGPLIALFFLNYYILCPKCFFVKGRRKWFFIINALIIFGWRLYKIFGTVDSPAGISESIQESTDNAMAIFYVARCGVAFYHQFVVILQHLIVGCALAICYVIRSSELESALESQKRNAVEAELSWLKNQLNPHFLFNTLNNISSLTAIDSEAAQESIAELSSLMRYVLYDSDKERVSLSCEIEFMENYINLMKLRCTSNAQVKYCVELPQESVEIAPLLFISIVENAFKHGIKSNATSYINIRMTTSGRDLVFTCSNSLFEKAKTDMAGSGIGIQNMKKRLELIYPGQYSFEYGPSEDEYNSTLIIKNLFSVTV